MHKLTVLILAFSPLDRDPRVQRQIRFLQGRYKIVAAGCSDPDIQGAAYVSLPPPDTGIYRKAIQAVRLKTGRFETYYWSASHIRQSYHRLLNIQHRLLVANDLATLPLALRLARKHNSKVLVDAHEYEPRHFDDNWVFNFFFQDYWKYICRHYLPRADAMTTVCNSIADRYLERWAVSSDIITNAGFYHELTPQGTESESVRMVHHGICNPSRRLEDMIELVAHLDERFTLDLMLVADNPGYYRKLRRLAGDSSRVRFRDPVPMNEIVPVLNAYDIGLFLLSPHAYNYLMALPNKLFEFIQARLTVAIWPSPEMAKLVNEYGVGVVADEFTVTSAAASLNALTNADIDRFKQASDSAARILCAERNGDVFLNIVSCLMVNDDP